MDTVLIALPYVGLAAVVIALVACFRDNRLAPESLAEAVNTYIGGSAVVVAAVCLGTWAFADAHAEDNAYAALIERIETKYDVNIDDSDPNSSVTDPRTWIVDDQARECFVEGLDDDSETEEFDATTDPVLRCEPAEVIPEVA